MDFKIQNMVGSCDVKFPIRLEGLVVKHSQFSRLVPFSRLFKVDFSIVAMNLSSSLDLSTEWSDQELSCSSSYLGKWC